VSRVPWPIALAASRKPWVASILGWLGIPEHHIRVGEYVEKAIGGVGEPRDAHAEKDRFRALGRTARFKPSQKIPAYVSRRRSAEIVSKGFKETLPARRPPVLPKLPPKADDAKQRA